MPDTEKNPRAAVKNVKRVKKVKKVCDLCGKTFHTNSEITYCSKCNKENPKKVHCHLCNELTWTKQGNDVGGVTYCANCI